MNPQVIAATWLLRHASRLPRHTALEECTKYLVNTHGLGPTEASRIALQALAERECTNAQAWIDTDASTSHFIVLRRPGQKPVALTVCDLLRLTSMRMPRPTTH